MLNKYIKLISDTSFFRWVMDLPKSDSSKWDRWQNEETDRESFVSSIRGLFDYLVIDRDVMNDQDRQGLWLNIRKSIEVRKAARIKRLWTSGAVASVTVLLSIFGYYSQNVEITTAMSESRTIELPGKSKVLLNAGTKVSYNKLQWYISRNINLKGEAFFNVTKGREFIVNTERADVKVLGTSFNVYSRKDNVKVECFTGKVRVEMPEFDKKDILTRGMAVSLYGYKYNKYGVNVSETTPDWNRGRFVYNNKPYIVVLEELERQFGVSISNKKVAKGLMFTGLFLSNSKTEAFETVLAPIGYRAEISGNSVRLVEDR